MSETAQNYKYNKISQTNVTFHINKNIRKYEITTKQKYNKNNQEEFAMSINSVNTKCEQCK